MGGPGTDPEQLFQAEVERSGYVQRMFASIAHRYDLMNTLMTGGRHHAWRRLAATELVRPGDTVVDVGCGTGDLAIACLSAGAARVLGVDFARPMLPRAVRKARRRRQPGIFGAACGDATHLPISDEQVDAWCSAFVVRNVPDLDAVLTEAWRVLKPGGRLAILEITKMKRSPWRPFVGFHLSKVVPIAGRLISGHSSAYRYLPVSVGHFLTPEQFSGRLVDVGFELESVQSLMLGTISLQVATKPLRMPPGPPSLRRLPENLGI